MKERPILFSAPMVQAILDGKKTQTRRIIKDAPQDADSVERQTTAPWMPTTPPFWRFGTPGAVSRGYFCRLGEVGDRLWVRESCALVKSPDTGDWHWPEEHEDADAVWYRATDSLHLAATGPENIPFISRALNTYALVRPERWRPSIHMPRWASRITLEIVDVRVERLNDISADDARAEGTPGRPDELEGQWSVLAYARLWDQINGEGAWAKNPWVWVLSFRRIKEQERRSAA